MLLDKYTKQSPIIGVAGMGGGINSYIFLSGGADPYIISRSLRLDSGSSSYLSRPVGSASNRTTWTWSSWVKRSNLGVVQYVFEAGSADTATERFLIRFQTDDTLLITVGQANNRLTSQVFRDPSSWGHLVVAVDTTISSPANNRIKVYWNGVQINDSDFATITNPNEDALTAVNSVSTHSIGKSHIDNSGYLDAYLSDVHFIDGQALAPTDFGETDSDGVWQAKKFAGTYGTNGFHLDFADNSSSAALGYDAAGSNNWDVHNLIASDGAAPSKTLTRVRFKTDWNWMYVSQIKINGSALTTGTLDNSGSVWTDPDKWKNGSTGSGNETYSQSARGDWFDVTLDSSIANFNDLEIFVYLDSSSGSTTNIFEIELFYSDGTSFAKAYAANSDAPNQSSAAFNSRLAQNFGNLGVDPSNIDSLRDSPSQIADQTGSGSGGDVVGNYCTLNTLAKPASTTYSNGNLDITTSSGWFSNACSIGISSGKWYYEFVRTGGSYAAVGWRNDITTAANPPHNANGGGVYFSHNGTKQSSAGSSSYGAAWAIGDVIGIAFDRDAGTITFYKNGVSQGQAFSGMTDGTFYPEVYIYQSSGTLNFGQRAFAHPLSSNPTYSQSVSGSVASSPYDATKMFDGSLTTFTDHAGQNSTITWTYTLTGVTSLRVYIHEGNSTGTVTTVGGSGTQADTISTNFGPGWHTISLTNTGSTINSIAFTRGGSGNPLSIYAIEVNGTVLVEGAGAIYKSLNTANLPEPTIADGSQYFDTKLYTGNGSTQTISGLDFSPDLVWFKSRNEGYASRIFDQVRGTDAIYPSETDAEGSNAVNENLVSYNSDGFTVGTTSGINALNNNNKTMAAWAWDAGDSTTTIAAGSLNSSSYLQDAVYSDSSNFTYTGTSGFTSNNGLDKLFDGRTDTQVDQTDSWTGGTTAHLTWTPATAIPVTSTLRIYGRWYTDTANNAYLQKDTVSINGNSEVQDTTVNSTSAHWFDLTSYIQANSITSITEIKGISYPKGSNRLDPGFMAIEVDGKILVDSGVTPPNVPAVASTVRSSPESGFSIVSYTGNGSSSATVGHGLNAQPSFLIVTSRSSPGWFVCHSDLSVNHNLRLTATVSETDVTTSYSGGGARIINNSTFGFLQGTSNANNVNQSSINYIAYCFSPVSSYSSMGSYLGNGNVDGPCVFTGFRPAWIMIKCSNNATNGHWIIMDTKRDTYNVAYNRLMANESWEENNSSFGPNTVNSMLDILSNGFKIRTTSTTGINYNGDTYVYLAFAEHPFKSARAR